MLFLNFFTYFLQLIVCSSQEAKLRMAVPIKVKWGKEVLQFDIDPAQTLDDLRNKIKELTAIPSDKQKIMGLRLGPGNQTLTSMGLVSGKQLMLIGTPEGTVLPTVVQAEKPTSGGSGAALELNGLTNLGNTCYLNSALQLIRSIPEVKETLLNYTGNNSILARLGELLKMLSNNTSKEVVPALFWAEFQRKYPIFAERDEHGHMMQQDAHEALTTLLQEVQTALPEGLTNLFAGELDQVLKKANESDENGKGSSLPFKILTCNISGEVQTIESGLQKAFNEEFITTDDTTGEESARTRVSRISKAPEYLLIHLVRFSWRSDIQKKAKLLKPISFPFTLDICSLVTEELAKEQKPIRDAIKQRLDEEIEKRKRSRSEKITTEDQKVEDVPAVLHNESGYYELCGVISHKGRSADSGHYIYWGKKGDTWVVYDDTNAAVVSEDDVLRLRGVGESHIAYVLLYRSRNPITKRSALPY